MLHINGSHGLSFLIAGVSIALAGFNPNSAQAAILFTNGGPASRSGPISDLCTVSICDPDTAVFNEVGDDFTLSSRSNIQSIVWSGAYDFGDGLAADDFSVRIFDVSNHTPLSMPRLEYSNVQVSRSDIGFPSGSLYLYSYDFSAPVTLAAGTYFLSIVNNTPTDEDDWFWAGSNRGAGNPFFRDRLQQSDGSFEVVNWQLLPPEASTELSFAIKGESVPTPILLPGLIGMGAAAIRKRKQKVKVIQEV